MAEETVKNLLDNQTAAVGDTIDYLPTDAISPEALKAALPTDTKCPPIPGLKFPELPDLTKLGEIADDALEKVDDLAERIEIPDTDSDVGERTSGVRIGKRAVWFSDKWLKKAWDIDADIHIKKDLKTVTAGRVYDIINKYQIK